MTRNRKDVKERRGVSTSVESGEVHGRAKANPLLKMLPQQKENLEKGRGY